MDQLRPSFLDGYLPYLLRQADQALSTQFYAVLTEHEVARSEWRVLAVLEDLGELSVLDLTTAALSPQPTVTHAVRRLVKRGLITSVTGTEDKRQRFVSLTEAGSALTKTLIAEARRLEAEALSTADGVAELVDRLKALTVALKMQASAETSTSRAEAS